MKGKFLFLVIIIFISLESKSQFSMPIQPWAKNIEKRVLVVQLEDENPKKVKKLKKKGGEELKRYRESISEQNEKLKELIPKYWPFDNKIEFKKTSEVEKIVKNKDKRYLILDYRYTKEIHQRVRTYRNFRAYSILVYYPEYGKKLIKSYMLDNNGKGSSKFLRRGEYVFKISFPHSFLNDRDIKFAFCQFEEFIERAKTKGWPRKMSRFAFKVANFNPNNTLILKERTLLFPEELLTINEDQIKDAYKASYRIVPMADIDSLLNNDINNEYAYYNIVWSDKIRYWTLVIIDNITGKILAENPTVDKKFHLSVGIPIGNSLITVFKTADVNYVINEKHMKNLSDVMSQ